MLRGGKFEGPGCGTASTKREGEEFRRDRCKRELQVQVKRASVQSVASKNFKNGGKINTKRGEE